MFLLDGKEKHMKHNTEQSEWFAEVCGDPALWAETFLRDPTNPQEALSLRSYQREILEESRNYKYMVLRYGRRMGKCSKYSDITQLHDGTRLTIQELWERYNNGEDLRLMQLEKDLSITSSMPILMEDNGKKKTFEVKTKSGRKINVTENHPLLRIDGWQPIADLTVGDQILVPSKVDYETTKEIDDRLVKFLGYLLGDGMITSRIELINKDINIINEFEQSSKYFDINTRHWLERGCYYSRVVRKGTTNNEAIDYLRELGLFGTNSHTKFVPNVIFELSKDQQALFLSRLYACDGWASVSKSNRKSGNCEIGYCSVSEDLIYGVSDILVRFGIKHFITEKNIKYKGTLKKAFQILICTKEDITTFINDIGIFSKEEQCNNVLHNLKNRSDLKNGYFYQVPKEAIHIYDIKTPRKYEIRKNYNTSKEKLLRAAKDQRIEDLVNICHSDTYFDEIVSITSTGNNQTYAIEVPRTHNYIVGNVITHNTVAFCADALWWTCAQPLARLYDESGTKQVPLKVLVLTPMDSQIKLIFDTLLELCSDSPFIQELNPKIRRSDVNEISFSNGSVIKGMTIGISSANKGTSCRGQNADYIFLDECDYIPREIMEESILPISNTNPDCKIRACSTPSGKRDLYFEWCFTKGNKVNTSNGFINIEDIRPGDKVFGEDGEEEFVVRRYKQPYKGQVYSVDTSVGKFECTPNHEIKTFEGFKRCEDITKKDYIAIPKESYSKERIIIDPKVYYNEFDKERCKNFKRYKEIGCKTTAAKEIYGSSSMRRILLKYENNQREYSDLWPIDKRRRDNIMRAQKFLDNIYTIDSKKLYRFLGYYVAEGNILKDFSGNRHYYAGIQLTFNSNEKDYINEVIDTSTCLFPDAKISQTKDRTDNSTSILIYSSWISYAFIELCGEYSKYKRINPSLLYHENTKCLLETAIRGDGTGSIDTHWTYVSKSESLINQLLSIAYRFGMPVGKYYNAASDSYQLGRISRFVRHEDDTYFIKVRDIKVREYDDYVYNLETNRTHTYNVEFMCTHNCTKADELGWWHRHYPSWHEDNPNWLSIDECLRQGRPKHESTEFQYRSVMSTEAYNREFGAEFGEENQGVYKHELLDRSMVRYCKEYLSHNTDVFDPGFPQNPHNLYVIGVDWNTYKNGGQVVMIEYCREPTIVNYFDDEKGEDVYIDFTGKFRLFYRKGVKSKQATQRETRKEIIRLLKNYKVDHVYVDYGAGDTNIEELTHYGKDHPALNITQKLHVVDSGSNIEHYDPVLKQKVKKRAKSMMINTSVVSLEEGRLVLPKEEDSNHRLVSQMRGYVIKSTTMKGDFTYEGEDHVLDAFNLAIWGFHHQYSLLLTSNYDNKVRFMANPLLDRAPVRQQKPQSPILSDSMTVLRDPELPVVKDGPKKRQFNLPSWGKRSVGLQKGFRRQF